MQERCSVDKVQAEGPEPSLRTHIKKKNRHPANTLNPRTGKVETGRFLQLTGQPT